VNATVASQRAAVAKWLAASFTLVRLLPGVHALVDGERGPLNELLAAAREVADVGSHAAVDTFVPSEVASSRKPFSASAAGIRFRRWLRPVVWLVAGWRHSDRRHTHRGHPSWWHGVLLVLLVLLVWRQAAELVLGRAHVGTWHRR